MNKIGVIAGVVYSAFSFFAFFTGLGHGASCPELGPETCDNPPFHVAISSNSFFVVLPHMISWGIFFYVGQQLMILANPQVLNGVSTDFTVLFTVVCSITFALWAAIGARSQKLVRGMKGPTSR